VSREVVLGERRRQSRSWRTIGDDICENGEFDQRCGGVERGAESGKRGFASGVCRARSKGGYFFPAAESAAAESAEPAAEPTEPTAAEPAEPAAEPAEPTAAESAEPAAEPTESAAAESAEPAAAEPTESATAESAEPAAAEPTESAAFSFSSSAASSISNTVGELARFC
jgi:hypothetical protein